MKKLILTIILSLFIFNSYTLDYKEADSYIGKYCYIQYYKNENSEIEIYNRIIGKVLDLIYDDEYKFVILDYKADLYIIRIDRIKQIKILKGEKRCLTD